MPGMSPHIIDGDLLVIGGSVGCLVAAIAAADAGSAVTLVLPPRGVGAGFAALARDGYQLDLGCRRLDLSPAGEAAPLTAYRPGMGSRPFAGHIRHFLGQRIGLDMVRATPPQMTYGGVIADDFVASLDLTSLSRMLNTTDLQAVERETGAILATKPPGRLTLGTGTTPDLASATLEDASLANHGTTFHHRLIAPFANKLYPDKWRTIPADLAGKIWTPLLYPRTIHDGCRNMVTRGRSAVSYFYPASGYFGELIEKLVAAARHTPRLTIIDAPELTALTRTGRDTTATLADGSALRWHCPVVLGTSVDAWCALAGIETPIEKLALSIIWLEIADDDLLLEPGLLHVFSPESCAYRVSFGGTGAKAGRHIITVEMTGGSHECTRDTATAALARLGIVKADASTVEIARNPALSITAPTSANRAALNDASTIMTARGIAPKLIGTLNDLRADTLNDHILQGLTAYA